MRSVLCACALVLGAVVAAVPAGAQNQQVPPALRFTVKDIDGKETPLSRFQGKVVMVVNVASYCGNTKQYASLQALHEKYHEKGLAILGFPSNDFGKQEPGSDAEIKEFCTSRFKVSFPMFSKIVVKGEGQAPLYRFLTDRQSNPQFGGEVEWNFAKFLLGRDGQVIGRIPAGTDPSTPAVVAMIEKALAAPSP